MDTKKQTEISAFVDMAVQFGKKYLACGGPTSRLENRLSQAGKTLGIKTNVFATPTGIFVSGQRSTHEAVTLIGRIKDASINLAQLYRLEKVLASLTCGDLSPQEASKQIRLVSIELEYSKKVVFLAAFLMGFGSSFSRFTSITEALLSGLVTFLVMFITAAFSRFLSMSGVFYEFFGFLLALTLAGICNHFFHFSGEAIINAISELADHNFVSGTAKTMRGILTLLAIGIAYFIFKDLSTILGLHEEVTILSPSPTSGLSLFTIVGCHLMMVLGFSVVFQCPKIAIPWALLTGLTSWFVLGLFNPSSYLIASYVSSLIVGLMSLSLSRLMHMPSQIFSVPGILSLVPGLLSLSTLSPFITETSTGQPFGMKVALIGSAIVFGLFSARVPFMLSHKKEDLEVLD